MDEYPGRASLRALPITLVPRYDLLPKEGSHGNYEQRRASGRRAGADRRPDGKADRESIEGPGGALRHLAGGPPGRYRAPRVRGEEPLRRREPAADRGPEAGLRSRPRREREPPPDGGVP